MGNRKQPFGYRMTLGKITIQSQEAETVRSIYLQYIAGVSFKQLAEQLQAADGIVLRDRSSGQRQGRERSGCRGVGTPASDLSHSRGLFSPQCAPYAGLLPDVRRYAGVAGSGNASELDSKCGHHGGWIDHGREMLVHSESRRKRLIQNGAAADD